VNWNEIPEISNVVQVESDGYLAELQLLSSEIPNAMLEFYLRKAAGEFAKRSKTLLRRVKIKLQPCVTDYPVDLPEGELFDTFQGKRDNRFGVGSYTVCGRYYVQWNVPSQSFVVGTPEPKEATDVFIIVATTLNRDGCKMDQSFLDRYHSDIVPGALSHLYSMKGEGIKWTDLRLAQYHERLFSNKITAAGIDRLNGRSSGRIQLKPMRTM